MICVQIYRYNQCKFKENPSKAVGFPLFFVFLHQILTFHIVLFTNNMDYSVTKFTIATSDDLLKQTCRELLADMIAEQGYESFVDTPSGLEAYIQTHSVAEEELRTLLENFPIEDIDITFSTEDIETKDWNEEWELQGFDPIRVGDRCIIYDSKSPDAETYKDSAEIAIAIDARMAFGTGTHETTQMIVAELLENNVEGRRVLDCGCGTGILSLVAKRCGAEHVTAYDIDEWSVENTFHNAEINNITLTDVLLGDVSVLSHIDGMFSLIMANINRNILLADMSQMVSTLDTDGVFVISGFYEDDIPMLLAEASKLGLYEVGRKVQNGWAMLTFHR